MGLKLLLGVAAAVAAPTHIALGQESRWNDQRSVEVVRRAIAHRASQFATGSLGDYTARANGYLTFLAQFGLGFPEPPRVVKVDQLAVEISWKAPAFSKQELIGQRDTLLLPAHISYYRDRFGIIQNNFPDLIRMGDGRDIHDVPHPLSSRGLELYDFAVHDSLILRTPELELNVYEIQVRPKDESRPGVIGAVYLDRDTGAVARMALTFTSNAFLDKRIERLSVVLENALIDRFWLPSHQEVEVVRQGTWLNFPARGIIRARWEVCCYDLNVGLPDRMFAGSEFVRAPEDSLSRYAWSGDIVDSLPDEVRFVSDEDARRVLQQASELVGVDALSRQLRGGALSAGRISDLFRVNRIEGVAFGAGVILRLPRNTSLELTGRFGMADHQPKGRLALRTQITPGVAISLFGERRHRDVGLHMETSPIRNTIEAGILGNDLTDPYDLRAAGLTLEAELGWAQLSLTGSYQYQDSLSVNASPLSGEFKPTVPAWRLRTSRTRLAVNRPSTLGPFGSLVAWHAEITGASFSRRDAAIQPRSYLGRMELSLDVAREFGKHRLLFSTHAAGVTASSAVPPQDHVFFGGPVSAPGYGFHELVGTVGASHRIEWQFSVPFFSIGLGKFGRSPASATLAPFAHAVVIAKAPSFAPDMSGFRPSVGIAGQFLFDLLRIQTARGLRSGRWTFSIDISRRFWNIL